MDRALFEEFLVLEGNISINQQEFTTGCYGQLPAGLKADIKTPTGATVLSFFESNGNQPTDSEAMLCIDTSTMPWSNATDPNVSHATVGLKELSLDAATGERTWILKIDLSDGLPFEIKGVERHPVVEELFVLQGCLDMPTGRLKPGAYFWRPPHLAHGPTRVMENFVGFFRCKGGRFSTEWSTAERPLEQNPSYNPVLPETLKALAASPFDENLRF